MHRHHWLQRSTVVLVLTLAAKGSAQTPVVIRTLGSHALPVMAVVYSPDGSTVASASGFAPDGVLTGQIRLWDVGTGQLRRELAARHGVFYSLAFSPDGTRLAAGGGTGVTTIWDLRSGSLLHALEGNDGPVRALAFSPDGRTLASGGIRSDGIRLWNPVTGKLVAAISAHTGGVTALAFSPKGDLLATVGRDRMLKLWRTESGVLETVIGGLSDLTLSIAFAPDGRTIALGGPDVILLDPATGALRVTLRNHPNTVSSVAYLPDGRALLSATGDGDDVRGGKEKIAGLPEFQMGAVTAGRDGGVTTAKFGRIYLHDAATGHLKTELAALTDYIWSIGVAPDGKAIATGTRDGTVRTWRLE